MLMITKYGFTLEFIVHVGALIIRIGFKGC